MPAAAEVQAATLEKFIKGWSEWNPDGFLATWTNDCTTTTLPFSSGVPTRNRAATERHFPVMMSFIRDFEASDHPVHNVVHDVARGKAAIYAVTKGATPLGPYSNEHALFLWFDESGEKVQKIEEMFDGDAMKDFLHKFNQYVAQQNADGQT
ncbi:hypothetical protein DL767_006439 [Monosporascus sp. MG133]|nr:hypothetical protein DL767_006439 [Monosporascus sp. MG133]